MDCPTEERLLHYARGTLNDAMLAEIETHVVECSKCYEAVQWVQTHLMDDTPSEDDFSVDDDVTTLLPRSELLSSMAQRGRRKSTPEIDGLSPSSNPDAIGMLGQYDILDVIGKGGMGVVLKGFDHKLHRVVAIKRLKRELAASETAKRRFKREAKAAAAINHLNVVTIHSVEEHEGVPFLVMEYIQGQSLSQKLREHTLDVVETVRLSSQIVAGLAEAHKQGVIHRDIKPGNIMLEEHVERVKLSDFGLARIALDNSDLTSKNVMVGTPAYMAPEQVRGETVDGRADLFGLGCVMYAMLKGKSPFHGKTVLEMAQKVTDFDPPPLHEQDPDVPEYLSAVISKLIEKDPEQRFETAKEVERVLNEQLAEFNLANSSQIPQLLRPAKPKKKRSLMVAISTVCVLVALGLVGYFVLPDIAPSDVPTEARSILHVGAGGQHQTISSAIEQAKPNTTIYVAPGTYNERLIIDQSKRLSGLIIEGVLASPGEEPNKPTLTGDVRGAAITISNTPGVQIRNLAVQPTDDQLAITLTGDLAGVLLEDLICTSPPTAEKAFFFLNAARGTKDAPIVLRGIDLDCQDIGIILFGNPRPESLNKHILIEDCKLSGTGSLLILDTYCEDIVVTRNRFLLGERAVSMTAPSKQQLNRVSIRNNTFFQTPYWVSLNNSSLEQGPVDISRNLILSSPSIEYYDSKGKAWFTDNWWQGYSDESEASEVGTPVIDPRVNLSPDSPDFLRPLPDSPLKVETNDTFTLPFIGALPPIRSD